MAFVHCPACGADILDLEQVLVADVERTQNLQHELLYDLIKKEKERLQKVDISKDYRRCKALASCYELQDYLANLLAKYQCNNKEE